MKESAESRMERQARERWQFIDVLRRAGNVVEEEVKFHPERKWRIDLVIKPTLEYPIALEIEGRGRHQSFYGYAQDMEKYNQVTIAGYRLLRVTRDMIANGDALELLSQAGVNVEAKDGPA